MRFTASLCLLFSLCIIPARFMQAQEEAKTPPPQTAQASAPAPKIEEPERVKAYVISTGDTLNVTVARRPELNWRGQINSDGDIPILLYLEKPVRALCRTEVEVAKEIADAYSKLIRNPEVTVRVIERSTRPVIMFGAVRTPQRFQLQRDVRLNELLFITGGVTDRASGDIQIFTPEPVTCLPAPDANTVAQAEDVAAAPNPIKVIRMLDLMAGKEETNPLIRPGDIVTVMVAEPVYLTGGVVSPQGINFREQLTLTRAIATVGGLSEGARAGEIRIYRRLPKVTEQEIIKADYNAIKKQQQPDIPLKAYDIVEVPRSSGSQARRSWHSAAQEIVTDEKQSAALPLRILN